MCVRVALEAEGRGRRGHEIESKGACALDSSACVAEGV